MSRNGVESDAVSATGSRTRVGPVAALRGSRRPAGRGTRSLGPSDPGARVELTIVLRPARRGRPGASPEAVAAVGSFARRHALDVDDARVELRRVRVSGTVAAVERAFGVRLERYEGTAGSHRGHRGPVRLPAELRPAVLAVLGLDDRPQARPQFRRFPSVGGIAARATAVSYPPPEVATLYDYPPGTDGSGRTVALVELGGGYRDADLTAYFAGLGLPVPAVTAVGVDGATNAPTGDPGGPDGEVLLDLDVLGSVAPGAAIAVYFAPNTDRGFHDAVIEAVHAPQRPAAVSISWGAPEADWTGQARAALDTAIAEAGALGVTVCCAAGDNGSADGLADGRAHVDFPASSPHALACGGTRLLGTGSTIASEAAWNDGPGGGATGGGVSDVYPLPAWQAHAGVPASANPGGRRGRGVPDVAGDADPQSGYRVQVDGSPAVYGGTSAVAPLWAGLVARFSQALGAPLGFLNPRLYAAAGQGFHDVLAGSNGAYSAGPGWDPCTGLGSPDGARLLAVIRAATVVPVGRARRRVGRTGHPRSRPSSE